MRNRLTTACVVGAVAALTAGGAAGAVSGGTAEAVPAFVAKIVVHDAAGNPVRGCSGVLVQPQWVMTAGQCFAGSSGDVTVGGATQAVTSVVTHPGRNVALARLTTATSGVTPARLAAAPTAGEVVTVAGWGRTASAWVPNQPHRSQFRVDAAAGNALDLVSATGDAALCKGDAGGPLLRGTDVAALATSSFQRNCLEAPAGETRDGAGAVVVGDLTGWMLESISAPAKLAGMNRVRTGQFTADRQMDVVATEASTGKLWLYPGTASPLVLDKRIEIGRAGWNGVGLYTAGDTNGDGLADLLVVQPGTGKLVRYANTGQSGLAMLAAPEEVGRSSWQLMNNLAAGDFNGDGRVDVVASQSTTGKLLFYRNTGGTGLATFATAEEIGRSSWDGMSRLAAGDLNADGRADVVAVQNSSGAQFSYLNTGGSGLAMLNGPHTIGRSSWMTMSDVATAELTGDGHLDVFAVTAATGDVWAYPHDGTGKTEAGARIPVRQIG